MLSFADGQATLVLDGPHDVLRSTTSGRTGRIDGDLTLAPHEAVVLSPRRPVPRGELPVVHQVSRARSTGSSVVSSSTPSASNHTGAQPPRLRSR